MTESFTAFRVFDEGGTVTGRIVQLSLADLSEGAVVIKTAFSSVNYKDALAATGAGKIMRRFPLVGGIDLSGTVTSGGDARTQVLRGQLGFDGLIFSRSVHQRNFGRGAG